MYAKVSDFIKDWQYEKEATAKVLANVTDESLNVSVSDTSRTLGRVAWHITTALGEIGHTAGLDIEHIPDDSDVPAKASEIYERYKKDADLIEELIQKEFTNESLSNTYDAYGQVWTFNQMLVVLIRHQAHHRGQLTVYMRKAGLSVPGIYGPSQEEWKMFGKEPLK